MEMTPTLPSILFSSLIASWLMTNLGHRQGARMRTWHWGTPKSNPLVIDPPFHPASFNSDPFLPRCSWLHVAQILNMVDRVLDLVGLTRSLAKVIDEYVQIEVSQGSSFL